MNTIRMMKPCEEIGKKSDNGSPKEDISVILEAESCICSDFQSKNVQNGYRTVIFSDYLIRSPIRDDDF